MPDDPNATAGGDDAGDAALDRELRGIGPLMRRQELLEVEKLDPAFARDLRARLTAGAAMGHMEGMDAAEGGAPDPTFARRLRQQLVDGGAPTARQGNIDEVSPGRTPRGTWAGLVAALVAVAAAAVLLLPRALPAQHHGANTAVVALGRAPLPGTADLTRDYPLPPGVGGGGGGGGLASPPEQTLFDQPEQGGVQPFYSPLHLPTPALPHMPATLPAYALAGAPAAPAVVAMARRLGLRAPVRREGYNGASWLAAADRTPSRDPRILDLRSVAWRPPPARWSITTPPARTRRSPGARRIGPWPSRRRAPWRHGSAGPARACPSGMRPSPGAPPCGPSPWAGRPWGRSTCRRRRSWSRRAGTWPRRGCGRLSRGRTRCGRGPSAWRWTWCAGEGPRWPSRRRRRSTACRSRTGAAWQVAVEHVFTAERGRLYLVPVYRFAGTARFRPAPLKGLPPSPLPRGPIDATWYALVPAQG